MTRAAIKIKKLGEEDLYFYTHTDGYPTCVLVNLIHMRNKNNYDKFVSDMRILYDEIYGYPSDINYSYVIDFNDDKIFTHAKDQRELLRIDLFDTDVIEIEGY